MNERALLHLLSIMERHEDATHSTWPQHEAEEISFSKWAVGEMIQQVWDQPWTIASETIDKFAFKMEIFAVTSVTDIQRRIFRIAAETAWDLLESIQEIEQ